LSFILKNSKLHFLTFLFEKLIYKTKKRILLLNLIFSIVLINNKNNILLGFHYNHTNFINYPHLELYNKVNKIKVFSSVKRLFRKNEKLNSYNAKKLKSFISKRSGISDEYYIEKKSFWFFPKKKPKQKKAIKQSCSDLANADNIFNKIVNLSVSKKFNKKKTIFLPDKYNNVKDIRKMHTNRKSMYLNKKNINGLSYFYRTTKSLKNLSKENLVSILKLNKINSLLKYKFLSLQLESIISFFVVKSLKVKIIHFMCLVSSFKSSYLSKFVFNKQTNKKKYVIILFCFIYSNTFVLNNILGLILQTTKSKQHIKNLLSILNVIKTLFNSQIISIYGFKFQIKGKLGGKLRKSKFKYSLGKITNSSFSLRVCYSAIAIYTKYGVFGLKT
jgi:hypothetical protein